MYAKVTSLGLFGLDAYPIETEADTAGGLPAFELVGLPDAAVSESRGRVRAAIKNTGFTFPVSRITVNLAAHFYIHRSTQSFPGTFPRIIVMTFTSIVSGYRGIFWGVLYQFP